jgi:hypothetical protein
MQRSGIRERHAIARAAKLIHGRPAKLEPDLINFIETILVYKLPRSTREEIKTMLGITDIDLKQTRFHQDVHAEGKLEGQQLGEALILRRLLTRRFGPLPDWAEQRQQDAMPTELECWASRCWTPRPWTPSGKISATEQPASGQQNGTESSVLNSQKPVCCYRNKHLRAPARRGVFGASA